MDFNTMCEQEEISKIMESYSCLLLREKLPDSKDVQLKEIGCLVYNFESFLSSQPEAVCNKSIVLSKIAELIVHFGLVQAFEEKEDRDFEENDFPFEAEHAILCFEYLTSLLIYYEGIETSCKRKFLVQALLLCATHNEKYLWSSETSIALCADFLTKLLACTKHKSLSVLLTDETFHPTIFKAVLRWMRPTLMKETWMKNPSSCYIFYWILSHVKHPYLVDYLADILPPSFMFSSYHSVSQMVLGIKCFDHILDNVPPTLIKADGTEEAMYDVLKRISNFDKELAVVEVLYPCLLKLPMMNLEKADQTKWLQFDTILQQLLVKVTVEHDQKLCCLFLCHTYIFVKATPCFKHLKKLLSVVFDNLTANSALEEEKRIISLKILKELIKSCWPRMENHFFDIMQAILKVICDIECSDNTIKDSSKVLSLCEDCLFTLKLVCPQTFRTSITEYLQDCDDSLPGANLLRHLIEA